MPRNNRQHKKLHSGPHQEFGFEVRFRVKGKMELSAMEELYDGFVEQAIEANGLSCRGVGGSTTEGFSAYFLVERVREQKRCAWKFVHQSVTEEDRAAVKHWLTTHPAELEFEVGPLVDVWRGLDPVQEF